MIREMTRAERASTRARVIESLQLADARSDRQFEASRRRRAADDVAARARRRDLTALPGPSTLPDDTGFYSEAA